MLGADEDADGKVISDPLGLLQAEATGLAKKWGGKVGERRVPVLHSNTSYPRFTPRQLRAASLTFRRTTASSYDGLHMRHYALLGGGGLHTLACVLELIELTARFPRPCRRMLVPLLEKRQGGFRDITIFSSPYRLWARGRKGVVTEWEVANARPYYLSAARCSPTDAVWRRTVKAEAEVARGAGTAAAAVLWA